MLTLTSHVEVNAYQHTLGCCQVCGGSAYYVICHSALETMCVPGMQQLGANGNSGSIISFEARLTHVDSFYRTL